MEVSFVFCKHESLCSGISEFLWLSCNISSWNLRHIQQSYCANFRVSIPSAWEIQGQSTIRSYLAPLDRCMSLIGKYIPPEDLDPPDGPFCAEYAEIASRLALAYLCPFLRFPG